MGKRKQGASLRAKKRANETHEQLDQALSEHGASHRMQSKKDDELFVLDTHRKDAGSGSRAAAAARRALEKKSAVEKRQRKLEYSEREQRKIQKVLQNHGKEGAIALAERGRSRLEEGRIRKRISAATSKPTFDLWGEEASAPSNANKKRKLSSSSATTAAAAPAVALSVDPIFDDVPAQPVKKLSNKQLKARKRAAAEAPPQLAVEVAHPGQSYRPDGEHHQDAIGEALSIEIRRNEAEEYKARPISEGMSAFTRGVIVESSSDEEDSSDDDDDDDEGAANANGTAGGKIIKRKEKLTRAQRNKQKRVKALETELKERRARKQFLHQANEVHVHHKEVQKAEKANSQRRVELAQFKAEKKSRPLGKDVWGALSRKDPTRAPSLPVALTEELVRSENADGGGGGGAGLRTVVPKGSLVTDRVESMVARNMMTKKKREGRRVVQGKKRPKFRGAKGTEYLLI